MSVKVPDLPEVRTGIEDINRITECLYPITQMRVKYIEIGISLVERLIQNDPHERCNISCSGCFLRPFSITSDRSREMHLKTVGGFRVIPVGMHFLDLNSLSRRKKNTNSHLCKGFSTRD